MSSLAMLGKGGRLGLTRRVDNPDGRAVARAVLVEILRFEQRDHLAPAPHVQSAKVGHRAIA
jgi:hypothetical protein